MCEGFTLQTFSVLKFFRFKQIWFINTYGSARKFWKISSLQDYYSRCLWHLDHCTFSFEKVSSNIHSVAEKTWKLVLVLCRVFNFFFGNIKSLQKVWIKYTVDQNTYKYFASRILTLSIFFFNFPLEEILSWWQSENCSYFIRI